MGGIGNIVSSAENISRGTVLSVYQAYAAKELGSLKASLLPKLKSTAISGGYSKSIILRVEQQTGTPVTRQVSTGNLASGGSSPVSQTYVPPPQSPASLTFDVTPTPSVGPDGFVQSIRETYTSRETVHNVASGFYLDQFNLAPGQFNLTITTLIRGDFITRVKIFTDVLRAAKMSNSSLAPSAAPNLRYVNSVDGRSLLLTQSDVTFDQSADRPNILYVTITGLIMLDYAYPPTVATPAAIPDVGILVPLTTVSSPSSTQKVLAGGVGGLANFS